MNLRLCSCLCSCLCALRRPVALACVLLCAGLAERAAAQQGTEAAAAPQRVEITGSSIKRIEGEGALPVQVITREDIRRTGASNVEQLLQTVTAAASANNAVAASSSGATTAAISTVSLRGLSGTRTLVLINGRRISGYGTVADSASVDVNAIPLAAIDRVEILKDGASAIYGSDAIAGVINFVLRKSFSGIELNLEHGSSRGGGDISRAGGAYGVGDLGSDGYNVFGLVSLQKEQALFGRDRDFASSSVHPAFLNDTTSGNAFPANIAIPGFPDGNPAYPDDCAPSVVSPLIPGVCRFDPAPQVSLFPDAKRLNVFAGGRLQWGDNWQAFAEFSWSRNEQRVLIQPVPISDQFALPPGHPLFNIDPYNGSSTIVLKPASAFYPTGYVRSVIGADAALPDVLVRYRAVENGPRDVTITSTQPRLVLGVEGTAGGWDLDAALLRSESRITEHVNSGFPSLEKVLPLLNSGEVNFFGPNTPDIAARLKATEFVGDAYRNKTSLTSLAAKGSRELFALPGGAMAMAIGAEQREETYEQDPDPTIQTGDISGYGGNFLPVDQKRSVSAVFVEVNAPIVTGLELSLAGRFDRYGGVGNSSTPKASLRWQPMKELLIRAAAGRGFRAPSLTELYAPQLSGVTANGATDPVRCPVTGSSLDCATQFPTLAGGNPALSPERSTNTTLGIVVEPVRNLSLGLDLFELEVRDTIVPGLDPEVILNDLARYAVLVTRGPADPNFPGLPGRITQVLQTNLNLGVVRMRGVEFDGAASLPIGGFGKLGAQMGVTYFDRYEIQNVDGVFENALGQVTATAGLVPRWRSRVRMDWSAGDWVSSLAYNAQSRYDDFCGRQDGACRAGDTPPRKVAHYETWDALLSWRGLPNTTLTLGMKNLLDRDPPYTNAGGSAVFQSGYDPTYADPRGRFVYARLSFAFP
jgi:iron complex outermembrane recepter protein